MHNINFYIFDAKLYYNYGISFGLFKSNLLVLILLPLIFLIILYIFLKQFNDKKLIYAYTFLVGGFIGNLYDRIINGYVIDFIQFKYISFFICNVADIIIFLSVIYMLIILLKGKLYV